jgi:stage V sporulation protein G
MDITEVKVKLMSDKTDRLLAFCSITLDGEFVIRDLKIIEGTRGRFVAMPSRKLADKCPRCSGKNHLRAAFCNDCGAKLNADRAGQDERGRAKLHADIAHPINQACRERMQAAILKAYEEEVEKSKLPGYVPPDLDEYEFDKVSTFFEDESGPVRPKPAAAPLPPPPAASPAPVRPPSPPPPPAEPAKSAEQEKTAKPDDFAAGIF